MSTSSFCRSRKRIIIIFVTPESRLEMCNFSVFFFLLVQLFKKKTTTIDWYRHAYNKKMKYWLLSLHEQDNNIRFFMGQHFTTTCKWACLHKRHCKFLISGLYRHPSPSVPIKELQMKETSSKGLGHMNLLKNAEADSSACMADGSSVLFTF